MGVRFRKSIKVGGVRLNLNKRSVSVSAGVKGFRYTVNSSGRRTKTVSLPGTGLSYTTSSGGRQRPPLPPIAHRPTPANAAVKPQTRANATAKPQLAKPGLFATKGEKQLFRLMQKPTVGAGPEIRVPEFEKVAAKYPSQRLAALTLLGMLARATSPDIALRSLAEVYRSGLDVAHDPFLSRYCRDLAMTITLAPGLTVQIPLGRDLVGWALAQLHALRGEYQLAAAAAKHLTDTLASRVKRAEYTLLSGNPEQVLQLTDGIANTDDMNVLLIALRGVALRELGNMAAALVAFGVGLRSLHQLSSVRHRLLYERARTYSMMGEKSKARADLEWILAEDANYPNARRALSEI
jgi:tetratricopeptide (TPR) repeat protein